MVWEGDESVSVVSGNVIQSPTNDCDRSVGAVCSVKTSIRGEVYMAKIAGRGKLMFIFTCTLTKW